ncbi:putative Postreplication repair E3 ubiquitin-protein ligase rad18 [Aspergillus granulosus]|uniref:Postreplication repair E3 ubiquitin-protein ligase RAD18 n=1 Tax=Aspergillus granulosus TaxID=176169 RepID=A0ABR4HUQ9_9EURO
MEPTFDLPDSTDWLDTPLKLLAPLESSLRCQVCKDLFDNPVITSCSHTFCSLCIRRCLSTEGKCPTCRSSDQELKLRRNWAVQELVEAFTNARPSVLELARGAMQSGGVGASTGEADTGQPAAKKRRLGDEVNSAETQVEGVRTRSQSRGVTLPVQPAAIEIIDDIEDQEYIPDDGLVPCPICQRRMKNEAVFRHLDTCTGDQGSPAGSKQAAFGSLSTVPRRPFQGTTQKLPERLPVINYSLLKETVLRKKLKDLGIPSWGPRALLQRRHTEWMNLWNANCDSRTPKNKSELLRELEVWERTQGGNSSTPTDTASTVMRKDFDSAGWSANYDTDFKQLIANARKRSDAVVRSTIPSASPVASGEPQGAPVVEAPAELPTPEVQPTSATSALSPNARNGVVVASNPLGRVVPLELIPANPDDPDL